MADISKISINGTSYDIKDGDLAGVASTANTALSTANTASSNASAAVSTANTASSTASSASTAAAAAKKQASSTNTSSKIYLIGATSQTTNSDTYSHDTAYVGTDGCLYSNSTKVSVSGHTHSYAGSSSAGGSATSAVKLDTTTAGSATQPCYFTSGKPSSCTYSLNKTVPSDAVFTDTWRGIQNNLTSTSTTESLSAYQGKVLKDTKAEIR